MKRFGVRAHECETGAIWFSDLFEKTDLAAHVAHTLQLDPVEYAADVRAAAWILLQLGVPGVWPADRLKGDLALAVARLGRVVNERIERDPQVLAAIEGEIAALRERAGNVAG